MKAELKKAVAKAKKTPSRECEAKTEFCSGQLVARYGVNGSEKEKETFLICGPCAVILKRNGSRLKQVAL